MIETLAENAYILLDIHYRITPPFLMRKFNITDDIAKKICTIVWLRQHLEARKLAKEIGSA